VSPGAAALVLAAAVGGTVEISDRVEARVRDTYDVSGVVIDTETAPKVKLTLRRRPCELLVDYSPRFTLRQVDVAPEPDILQQGRVAASWHDRRSSVSVYQSGGYGRQSTAAIASDSSATPGATQIDSLPEAEVIEYVSSQTGLTGTFAASRRWDINVLLEYTLNGGAGARSQEVIPFEAALRGGVGTEYKASRRDWIGPTVEASRAVFSSGWDDSLILARGSWRHAVRRNTTMVLAGGTGWFASRNATEPSDSSLAPIVEAGISHVADAGLVDLELFARLSPVIDRVSGRVDERLESTASVTWNATRALGMQANLGVAQSVAWSGADAITLVYDTATVLYRVSRTLRLHTGVWSGWMTTRGSDGPPLQWTVSLGATFTTSVIPF